MEEGEELESSREREREGRNQKEGGTGRWGEERETDAIFFPLNTG